MTTDFDSVSVTPATAPVRDARRLTEVVIRMNRGTPEIPAVAAVEADVDAGIEAVAAVAGVPAVPAGTLVDEIEVRFENYSSTNEHHRTDNPGGVVGKGGANLYKGAKADALKAALFKAGAKAEIEARLAEDNIDA